MCLISALLLLVEHKLLYQGMRRLSTEVVSKCKRLEGKVAIVTASTDGIGYAIARRLAQEGAKVMISSRKEANVKKALDNLLAEGLTVDGTVCHVGKSEDRCKLFKLTEEKFGGLDILVSNAAVSPEVGPVLDCSEEVWDKIFDINVKCMFLLMKESLPLLRRSKSASMILVTSIAGLQPINILGAYSVTKTTLLGLCKVASQDLGPEGIRVNCVAPGIIKTKFSKALYESEAACEEAIANTSLKRLGMPEEVAAVAAFLASDDASYITGEIIVASGGMRSRL